MEDQRDVMSTERNREDQRDVMSTERNREDPRKNILNLHVHYI